MNETKKAPVSANPTSPSAPKPLKFLHEKGPLFRTFHADGVWGLTSPTGNIQLDFYLEREPSPTAVHIPVNPDGSFKGNQIIEVNVDSEYFVLVRDFQAGVVLSLDAAMQVREVLNNYINFRQGLMAEISASAEHKK
jgi:hypothetical protein